MDCFVWKVGRMYFPDGLPADFSDTIYVPLGDDFPKDYRPYLILFSGWGQTTGIVSGVNWTPCSGCGVVEKNGHKYLYGGFNTGSKSFGTNSDAVYFIFASKHQTDVSWRNVLKKKELDAQGEE